MTRQPQARRRPARLPETETDDSIAAAVRSLRTTTAAGLVPLLLVTSVPACALRSDTSSIPAEGWAPQAAQQRRPGGLGPRVVSDSQSAARTLSDWSRIEAVPVGTKTEVQLYDDEAPPDSRRVTGRFHAGRAQLRRRDR